jgi:hypothetical protein
MSIEFINVKDESQNIALAINGVRADEQMIAVKKKNNLYLDITSTIIS